MSNIAPMADFAPDPITHNITTVTPKLAQLWLSTTNTHNRPLSKRRYEDYALEMMEGRWEFNAEPIQFDAHGVLQNGQHRLMAVIVSETMQRFLVVRGLPAQAQQTMDQGTKRLPADQLHIAGIPAKTSVAAAIRVWMRWDKGWLFGNQSLNKVSTPAIVQWAQYNGPVVALMTELSEHQVCDAFPRPAVTIAVATKLAELNADDAEVFLEAAATGANLEPSSPILALRNRVHRSQVKGVKVTEKDQIAFFVMSWNAFRTGRPLTQLKKQAAWTEANFPTPK